MYNDIIYYLALLAAALLISAMVVHLYLKKWKATEVESKLITILHNELGRYSEQNKRLDEQNQKLESRLVELHNRVSELNSRISDLMKENDRLHSEVINLTIQIDRMSSRDTTFNPLQGA